MAGVRTAEVERIDVWGGKNVMQWPHLPQVTNATEAASDHAAVWVTLN